MGTSPQKRKLDLQKFRLALTVVAGCLVRHVSDAACVSWTDLPGVIEPPSLQPLDGCHPTARQQFDLVERRSVAREEQRVDRLIAGVWAL